MNDTILDIELPFPYSANRAVRNENGRTHKSTEAKHLRKAVIETIWKQCPGFDIPPRTELTAEYYVYCDNRQIHVNDWDNMPKIIQDAIFEAVDTNALLTPAKKKKLKAAGGTIRKAQDGWILEGGVKKIRAEGREPYCRVIISILRTREGVS